MEQSVRIVLFTIVGLLYGCAPTGDLGNSVTNLNQIVILGSHNSYKREIPAALLAIVEQRNPQLARSIDYYHHSLQNQLDGGLRQLEIDVLADEDGGLYATPVGVSMLDDLGRVVGPRDGFDPERLAAPGFKVLHIPDIDIFTHCAAFALCLQQVNDWSDQNPNHLPLFILINIKEKGAGILDGVQPVQFDPRLFDRLDKVIRSALPAEKLIVPDDVKGSASSLQQAVTTNGWPPLSAARGKILFIFDGNIRQANLYREGHRSLSGRVMFAAVPETEPEAAIMVVNDPIGEQQRIRRLVDRGFIVRTRSDSGYQSVEQMRSQFAAAVASGAQIISSDYYPGSPNAERRDYAVQWQ